MSLPGSISLLARPTVKGTSISPSSIVLPGGGTITGSAGSITETSSGTNQSISLLPSGTGGIGLGVVGATTVRLKMYGSSVSSTPDDAVWLAPQVPLAAFYSEGNTAGSGDFDLLNAGGTSTSMTVIFRKSGGTLASPTAVSTNNPVGALLGSVYDGGAFRNTASIAFVVDGSISAGTAAPQRIALSTGTGTSRLERVNLAGNGRLNLGVTADSQPSWTTTGIILNTAATTFTNSSTAVSGTAATAVFSSFLTPTLAATNATVTTTDAANVYIAGAPSAGSNMTITNPWALWVASGNVRIDGTLYVAGAATPAFRAQTTITSGAGASTGTLTNAPSVGNPTKWIPINDAGTTRYIPAW